MCVCVWVFVPFFFSSFFFLINYCFWCYCLCVYVCMHLESVSLQIWNETKVADTENISTWSHISLYTYTMHSNSHFSSFIIVCPSMPFIFRQNSMILFVCSFDFISLNIICLDKRIMSGCRGNSPIVCFKKCRLLFLLFCVAFVHKNAHDQPRMCRKSSTQTHVYLQIRMQDIGIPLHWTEIAAVSCTYCKYTAYIGR